MIAKLLMFVIHFYWLVPLLTITQLILSSTGHMSPWWLLLWLPLSIASLGIKWLTKDADSWR